MELFDLQTSAASGLSVGKKIPPVKFKEVLPDGAVEQDLEDLIVRQPFFIALIPHLAIGVLVTTLLAALTMGLLLPQLQLVALRWPWALPATGMVALICFLGGSLASNLGI